MRSRFAPKSKPKVRIEWSSFTRFPLVWGIGEDVFTYDDIYGVDADRLVTFEAVTDFTDTGCFPVAWEWSFGDGVEAYGVTVTHSYTTPCSEGIQAVLTVTDNKGRKWRARAPMYIHESATKAMAVIDGDMIVLDS